MEDSDPFWLYFR